MRLVWLNRHQISELFGRDIKTIGKHINNALKEELYGETVIANFATTAKDGKTYKVDYYNLEIINSVGYRVKSKRGVAFRRWANKVLKEYLIKGYAVNNERLKYLEKTVKLIDISSRNEEINNNQAKDILKTINSYSKALNLLNDYDYKKIRKPKGKQEDKKISYEEYISDI